MRYLLLQEHKKTDSSSTYKLNKRRKVSIEKAQKFMKDKDLAFFFETSAKTS